MPRKPKRASARTHTRRSAAASPRDARGVSGARRRWERGALREAQARLRDRDADFTTGSFRPVERLYAPDDLARRDWTMEERLGFPGEAPFARGVQATMYRGRPWTMRQYAGFGSAEESNERYRYLLGHGVTGLSVAFDLPTQIGLDSDDARAAGEVGRVGVAVDSLADMETLFAGIPLGDVTTSMTINAPASVLWAGYLAVARRQGAPWETLGGTIQNDILKEYIARGTYIFPPAQSLRLTVDTIQFAAEQAPRWNPISISGYHIREAGATAAQELAFTFGNAIAYVEACLARGLDVDAFASRLSFFFGCHNDLFEEVAKFRAARRLWANLMRDRFGARDPRSWTLRFHTQTCGVTLTAQQPENNVVRVALQALAAVLGGTQSLHTNSFDEALALPTEKAARIALRTQQLLAHEAGVAHTVDPAGGSYFLEALTDDVQADAEALLATVARKGGMARCIETGWVQREIHESAYRWQRAVEAGTKVVVGVNRFATGEPTPAERLRIDDAVERRQVAALRRLRVARDARRVAASLEALRDAARGEANLMPRIVDAVDAYATVGEVCHALRAEWGEYRPTESVA